MQIHSVPNMVQLFHIFVGLMTNRMNEFYEMDHIKIFKLFFFYLKSNGKSLVVLQQEMNHQIQILERFFWMPCEEWIESGTIRKVSQHPGGGGQQCQRQRLRQVNSFKMHSLEKAVVERAEVIRMTLCFVKLRWKCEVGPDLQETQTIYCGAR